MGAHVTGISAFAVTCGSSGGACLDGGQVVALGVAPFTDPRTLARLPGTAQRMIQRESTEPTVASSNASSVTTVKWYMGHPHRTLPSTL